jgi:hypothetical protein
MCLINNLDRGLLQPVDHLDRGLLQPVDYTKIATIAS